MPVSNGNCLFIHIPKCAGTSIEVALGVADEYPDIGLIPTSTRPHMDLLFGGGLQHLSAREIARNFPEVMKNPNLFSFSIIRDPVDRFISHILWKHHRFSENPHASDVLLKLLLGEIEQLAEWSASLAIFSNPFQGLEYCEGDKQTFAINDIKRHLIPQCAYLFDRDRFAVDAIYSIDRIDILERDLKRRNLLARNIPKRMVGAARKSLREILPKEAESTIRAIYHHDLRLNEMVDTQQNSDEGYSSGTSIKLTDFNAPGDATKGTTQHDENPQFPRRLWIYWHQGWNVAPFVVRKCLESWQTKNPTWEINVLSSENLHEFVELPLFYTKDLNLPLQALSDVIRIHLLARHGGVWADATTWCVRPLDEWLPVVVRDSGFFAYAKPAVDRPISSWFLAAFPNHQIIKRYHEATNDFWTRNTAKLFEPSLTADPHSKDYFWFHKLFETLLHDDETVADLWDKTPKISADGPHYLQFRGLNNATSAEIEFHIRNKLTNVYKLTWRNDIQTPAHGTVLATLFEAGKAHSGP